MKSLFERFIIEMTAEMAFNCSHMGDCQNDVRDALAQPKIKRQLKKISPDAIRAELRETGAWDDIELSDDAANQERIIWFAACNIRDELGYS